MFRSRGASHEPEPISKRHPAIREKIAPLMDYYAANAAAAVETREANKANKK